jgi:copper oxidase (laccase) domain-containing protein
MLTPLEADSLSILPGIRHGFFTRQGGTSRGLYASLNCGAGSKDDPVAVIENRSRIAQHLGGGAIGGVLEATVTAMEGLGAERSRIFASLGPCIGPKSYEVGPEFVAEFKTADAANARFFTIPKGRQTPHFDLPSYVMSRIDRLGLRRTERLAPCTYENESMFFSFRRATHRKESDYGRQISAIVVA